MVVDLSGKKQPWAGDTLKPRSNPEVFAGAPRLRCSSQGCFLHCGAVLRGPREGPKTLEQSNQPKSSFQGKDVHERNCGNRLHRAAWGSKKRGRLRRGLRKAATAPERQDEDLWNPQLHKNQESAAKLSVSEWPELWGLTKGSQQSEEGLLRKRLGLCQNSDL